MLGEAQLRQWFVRHHGEGAPNQTDLYRCIACHRLITWRMIRRGDVCCGGKVRMTNPTWWEVCRLFVAPWTV